MPKQDKIAWSIAKTGAAFLFVPLYSLLQVSQLGIVDVEEMSAGCGGNAYILKGSLARERYRVFPFYASLANSPPKRDYRSDAPPSRRNEILALRFHLYKIAHTFVSSEY